MPNIDIDNVTAVEDAIGHECVQTVRMVQVLNCLLGMGRVLAFSLLLIVHIRIVRSFHLNYSVLVGAAIAGCSLNGWTTLQLGAVVAIAPHLDYDLFPINVLDKMDDVMYLAVLACTLLAMAERTMATATSSRYERIQAEPVGLAVILATTLILCCCYVYFLDDRGYLNAYIFLGISLIELVVGIGLIASNRRAFKKERGRALSSRYQLAENIRALPPLITFVCVNALGTTVDYAAVPLFDITVDFSDDSLCGVKGAYIAMRVVSFFMKLLIPLALFVLHRSYRKGLATLLRRVLGANCQASLAPQLRNVLGVDIVTSATADEYFRSLAAQWSGPQAPR